jgi:predicted nucleic acid-binding protein
VIVIDAGVLATALADDGVVGAAVRNRLGGEILAAPELIDLEVASVFRKLIRTERLDADRAEQALDDLTALPIRRASHSALLSRCWDLRDNLTAYDAAYVALAEALEATLLTADARLARSTGPRCEFELIAAPTSSRSAGPD